MFLLAARFTFSWEIQLKHIKFAILASMKNWKITVFLSLTALFLCQTIFILLSKPFPASSGIPVEVEQTALVGKYLFQQYNCTACHQIYGLGGYMGPDLTNVMTDRRKDKGWIRSVLRSGTQRMPNFKLTEKKIDQLMVYLDWVGQSGTYPARHYQIHWNGTVTMDQQSPP